VDVTVNIHNPLTALLLFWDNLAVIAKTLLTTQLTPSVCLNSRLCKCVTLVVSTKSILLLCSKKSEKTIWARHSTFFCNNRYTKHVNKVALWLLDVYNQTFWTYTTSDFWTYTML